jgi:hypothetical protein
MWDYDGYIAKAKLFIHRGESYSDDGFALWLLLGLECLLRAPLAKIHPSLLAEPNGDSILHANGIDAPGDPKTVSITTVLKRLDVVVAGFAAVKKDASDLINLRNGELHSSATVLANIPSSDWLGRYYEVVRVVVDHLGLPLSDVLPVSVQEQAAEYAAQDREKIKFVVNQKLTTARALLATMAVDEVRARLSTLHVRAFTFANPKFAKCPVCENRAILDTAVIRVARDEYDEEEDVISREIVSMAKGLLCVVCELELVDVHEVQAAGLETEYVETIAESLADRYSEQFHEPDYGND